MPRRLLIALLAGMALSSCRSVSSESLPRILVVDPSGAPIAGAVLYPDYEYSSSPQRDYSRADLEAHSSGPQGVISVDLENYLWDADGCYHFRIRKAGYDDETVSISKDLFTGKLRVDMKPRTPDGKGPTAPGQHS
ncbi:MAG TPA: hypothetical protein VGG37_03490 [Opitutaceae bacterium]|jgi:hypothetical protein